MVAESANHFGSKSNEHYDSVRKHSKNGPGGASIPCAKGGPEVVVVSAICSESTSYAGSAGDVKLSTAYFVLIIYL